MGIRERLNELGSVQDYLVIYICGLGTGACLLALVLGPWVTWVTTCR